MYFNFFRCKKHMKKLIEAQRGKIIIAPHIQPFLSNTQRMSSLPSRSCWRCQGSFHPRTTVILVCDACAEITNKTAESAVKKCRAIEDQVRAELGAPLRKRARRAFEAQYADLLD